MIRFDTMTIRLKEKEPKPEYKRKAAPTLQLAASTDSHDLAELLGVYPYGTHNRVRHRASPGTADSNPSLCPDIRNRFTTNRARVLVSPREKFYQYRAHRTRRSPCQNRYIRIRHEQGHLHTFTQAREASIQRNNEWVLIDIAKPASTRTTSRSSISDHTSAEPPKSGTDQPSRPPS